MNYSDIRKKYGLGESTTNNTKKSGGLSYSEIRKKHGIDSLATDTNNSLFTTKGNEGYNKYLDDEKAKKNVLKYDLNKDGKEAWWEKALVNIGKGNVDTSMPMAGYSQVLQDIENDESYRRPREDWSEEQKSKFGELYLTDAESAYKYAEQANAENNKRKEENEINKIKQSATKNVGAGAGHTLGAIATAPLALADFLQDAAYANAGKEIGQDGIISPFEYSQAVTGGISEHLNDEYGTINEKVPIIGGKGLGDLYGLGTSIAQSMASAYTLGGVGTLISYFGQGAAAGVDDALSRGATDEQALLYGAALGAFEGVTEKMGIDNLFKLGSASTVKGLLKNILKQASVEGLEEGATSLFSNIADNIIMQDKSAFNQTVAYLMANGMSEKDAIKSAWWDSVEGIIFDTVAGAVSGSVSGSIHTSANKLIDNRNAKKTYGDGSDIVTEALEIDPNNVYAQQMQAKVDSGKALSGGQINRLVESNENALVSQDKGKINDAVKAKLEQYGETGNIEAIAGVVTKIRAGEKITKAERNTLVNSKYGRRVSTELNRDIIQDGTHNTAWVEEIGTERIGTDVYNRSNEQIIPQSTKDANVNAIPPDDAKKATEVKFETPAAMTKTSVDMPEAEISAPVGDAKRSVAKAAMTDSEGNEVEANVARIAEVEGDEATLELEGGETVKASDVDFKDSGIGFVYKAATDMVSRLGGFNVDAANLMVKGVNPGISEAAANLYVAGFNEAYRYGAMGYPVSALETGGATSRLSEKQRESAYNLGKIYGEGKVAEKQAKIDSISAINSNNDSQKASKKKKGKVYFDGSAVGKTLTERQRASLKGLRVISEATGVDIHIFESNVVDGKRQGANGWYDPSDNSIHLDLHAGVDGNGLMLFTASHEMTHHIREVAPGKFKIFADALLEEYTKNGVSIDELISRKLETLEANRRLEGKTEEEAYDLAYEEVVADAAESMLVDSNAIEALSRKLQAKDKGLWEAIKDFITKLVARIKAAYANVDPDSHEGKLVREMNDSVERLQKLWVDALLDASDVTTEKSLGESGIIVNSNTESASLMSVRDVLTDADRKKVSKALAERFGVTQAEAMDWLKAETSLASLILNPKYSQYLDYTADPNEEAIKSNSDYPQGTVDFSNICKKRRDFTEVMNRVLRNFPNHVFAATDLAKIRTVMEEEGMEVACAICYVEDRRQLDSVVAQDFIDSLAIYREGGKIRPDGKPFNANQIKAFNLIEGDTYTPSIYELISLEGRNSLKAKNPAMEEAWVKFNNARGMQSVRLLLNDAEYKRQILKYTPAVVKRKNDLGGLRIYSFSDAEMFHLIDIIQVITDSATVGLSLQGYTKVNEYARAVKDTGEKLNRSLIPKGDLGYHMENGRVVLDFDTVEGIDINHPDFFDNIDNPNIGNIVIGINATQIKAAMTSKFIDQIIPFHTGQSNEVLGEKGIAAWDNYKDFQSERDAKTKKKSSHQINIYTEVINAAEAEGHPITNKVEFVNKFLEVCKENNLIPRFSDFLNVDENGDYVYTEGYHKFLVDFKTFDQNTGEYLPQMPVKPIFDNEYITKLLKDYVKTQQEKDAKLAKSMPKVLERITKEIVNADGVVFNSNQAKEITNKTPTSNSDIRYSLRGTNKDDVEVYETSEEIKKLSYAERIETFKKIMEEEYKGRTAKFTRNGHTYYALFESEDIGKNIYGDKRSSPKGWKAKINVGAEGDIFELVENAKYDGSKEEQGKKIASHRSVGYWDYFIKTVQIDGTVFDLIANVRKKPNDSFVYSIQLNENKKIEASPPLSSLLRASSGVLNASNNSIAQDTENVNRKFSDRDTASFKGKAFWSGSVSLLDGVIEEVHSIEEAEAVDFHHSMYFSQAQVEKMENGENAFFWVDDGKVQGDWRESVPKTIIKRIEEQIKVKYQDRNPDSYSNRSLLANALETAVQNDIEREKLKQYKQKIDLINSEEQKLHDLREQIKELSFKKGARDTEAIKSLQFEANQAANRINTYDRQLLNLESTKALKGVLEREKAQARKRAEKQGKEALERYRERAAKTQRELMDRYQESRKRATEGRNKTAMRHKIKDVVNELNNYLLKGTKDKHVPIELQKAVAEALDAVNMDTVGADERIAKLKAEMMRAKTPEAMREIAKKIDHIEEMGGNMEAKISRLKTAYDGIINSEDPIIANSHDDVISNTIDRVMEVVGDTPLRDMSLYQLEAVYEMYRMVLHSIRTANKAFKAKKSEEISVIANRVLEEIDKLKKKNPLRTKMGDAASNFDWNNLKPVYAFERIGSESFTEVFNNVRAGEDTWAVDMTEAQAFLEAQKKDHGYNSWDLNKKYQFTSSVGESFDLTVGQIMSLYAYAKRGDQAKDHLKNGGFVFDGLTEVKKKNKLGVTKTYRLKNPDAYNISEEILAEITSKLSPEQMAFADAMQDYLSTTMGEKGNEVSLELYGVKLFKEKNYFPLKSAPQYLERAREQAEQTTKIKNKGFTKETSPKAKNPIVLTSFMDVWAGHVNEMSMYHAFTLALEDFYRVFNYKTPAAENMKSVGVIPFIEKAHGDAAVSYIDQLLKDLNGGARSDPRETLAKALMSRFKKASVMASLSVVVQQPSAIIRAQALVDAKYFVGKPSKHKDTWAEVKKYAPVAIIKEMGYFDVGMGKSSVEWLKGEKTFMDKVDDVLSKAPALADEYTWCAIWNAVKRETVHNNPQLKTSSEEFLNLVGERFTEVITKTQVYDSTLSKSANMRSKSGLMNMWTSFMAEPTTSINMLQDAFKKGNKKQIARTLGAVYGSVILNSALVSLVYAMRDDDEDETFLEKYLSRFTTEVVDGINPLTYIPFVKDIWSALQGYDIERADMSIISDLFGSLQQLTKAALKYSSDMSEEELAEYKKELTKKILGVTDSLASLTGIPVKNIRRDINGIINGVMTIIEDAKGRKTTARSLMDNIGEDLKDSIPVWGWFPDESKSDKLYDAIIKGDTAYKDRLESSYKSDSAYNSAIRKALRENDPRIKEAAVALYEDKYREYDRILNEIVGEGHFVLDNVKPAILQEYEDMLPDEETTETKEDKTESAYTIEMVYGAISAGDTAFANTMKEDIIRAHMLNGKDREDTEKSFNESFTKSVKEYFVGGEISSSEAKIMLVNFGGSTDIKATSKVQYWDYTKRNPNAIVDDGWFDTYNKVLEEYGSSVSNSGISIDMYIDYRTRVKNIDNKPDKMAVINSLPISTYQKDALYFSENWKRSRLYEAPWH